MPKFSEYLNESKLLQKSNEERYRLTIHRTGDSLSGFRKEYHLGKSGDQYFWMADKKHGKTFTSAEVEKLKSHPVVIKGKEEAHRGKLNIIKEELETPNLDMLFEAGMSAQDIAKELGISRQFVHRALKSAAFKLYKGMEDATKESPFKVLLSVAVALDLTSQEDFNDLKKMLPDDIVRKVEADAKNYIRGK